MRCLQILLLLSICEFASSATVHYDFMIQWTMGFPDGVWRNVIVINGQFPGPTIIANVGDTVVVNVTNMLHTEVISIHWHGIVQHNRVWMDGSQGVTQSPIIPGSSFVYTWVAEEPGTYWYHSHVTAQYVDGLVGGIIINSPNDPYKNDYDEDIMMLISDWAHESSVLSVTWKTYNFAEALVNVPETNVLINGHGVPVNCSTFTCKKCNQTSYATFTVTQGKRYRLRVVNVGSDSVWFGFSVDGHALKLISMGGIDVPAATVGTVEIGLGNRADLILTADQPIANYWIQARVGGEAFIPGAGVNIQPMVGYDGLAVLHYEGAPNGVPGTSPASTQPTPYYNIQTVNELVPLEPPTVKAPTMTIWYNISLPPTSWTNGPFYVNDHVFMHPFIPLVWQIANGVRGDESKLIYDVPLNSTLRIIFQDFGPLNMSHPLHLHGFRFQVLGSGHGRYDPNVALKTENPWYTDSAVMYGGGWMVAHIYTDNPGPWLLHCHNDVHLLWGLGMVLSVDPETIEKIFPPDNDFPLYDNYPAIYPRTCSNTVNGAVGHGPMVLLFVVCLMVLYFTI